LKKENKKSEKPSSECRYGTCGMSGCSS